MAPGQLHTHEELREEYEAEPTAHGPGPRGDLEISSEEQPPPSSSKAIQTSSSSEEHEAQQPGPKA